MQPRQQSSAKEQPRSDAPRRRNPKTKKASNRFERVLKPVDGATVAIPEVPYLDDLADPETGEYPRRVPEAVFPVIRDKSQQPPVTGIVEEIPPEVMNDLEKANKVIDAAAACLDPDEIGALLKMGRLIQRMFDSLDDRGVDGREAVSAAVRIARVAADSKKEPPVPDPKRYFNIA